MEYQLIHYLILSGVVALAYWHGHKTGVNAGAEGMYEHLYKNGVRKNDKVIVELEYEDRHYKKDF
jgi:hypothetical protein|tara:strand:- start:4369 stop:4563 length:195 start_codon:yes stop_codon:yes gene_type:complete